MKESLWVAVLAGLLVLPGAVQAADGAPKAETAAVKLVQMEKGAAYMDESSVHIVDAAENGVVAEVMILRSDGGRRTSVTRAAYRISGGQKDAVRGADGTWETVRPDSFDAACAARIRTILNDPLRQAQFVDEIQQALMKRWEAKEAAKSSAGVVVSIEPEAGVAQTQEAAKDKDSSAAEAQDKESAAEAKPHEDVRAEGQTKPAKTKKKDSRVEKNGPAKTKKVEETSPDVVVEITSHEPQVTIEALPDVSIRPETDAAGV